MVATTVEAIVGAAFTDAEERADDGLDIGHRIMIKLGLHTHPLSWQRFARHPPLLPKTDSL
jgi:hypothetical protein